MSNEPTMIRICQPFDRVCLQGGCGYCGDQPKVATSKIRRQAREKGWLEDLEYGLMGNHAIRAAR